MATDAMAVSVPSPYPVRFDVQYPESLSRWMIFVKWLLAIPHLLVLYALGLAAYVVWIIALFVILFTKKYPDGMFNFIAGYLRWSANVSAYVNLMRDEYPPFTFDAGKYPVTLEIEYPQELNRWLVLIKWLLVIPHFIVLFFLFIAMMVVTLIAFFAILFTKKYPAGMFKFSTGVLRWTNRAYAYYYLMRDEYPPFSLD
jgi:hypothetical protein